MYKYNSHVNFSQGVPMETSEGQMNIQGSLATLVGDNLESHAVGGFKKGGSALVLVDIVW